MLQEPSIRAAPWGSRRRWPWTLVLFTALLAWAVPAHAHLRLERAAPAAGTRLDTVPAVVRLVFSLPVEPAFARLSLVGPSGEVGLDRPAVSGEGRVLSASVRGSLTPGAYSVRWQVAGPDGHPVRGEYSFRIEPGAAGLASVAEPGAALLTDVPPPVTPSASPTPAARFDASSPPYTAVRWLTFVGLLGVIGTAAFRLAILGPLARSTDAVGEGFVERAASGTIRVGLAAVALLTVALLLRLYAQSVALNGAGDALEPERLAPLFTGHAWGWGWTLQATGGVLALVGLLLARRRVAGGWSLIGLGALMLAFTPALSGHAVAQAERAGIAVVADAAHVLGAGGWLGALFLVVAVGVPAALGSPEGRRGPTLAALVNAFSPAALVFAGLVVTTGLASSWIHLGTLSTLWESDYGRTLLLKLALLCVVFATGAYNWLRVRPALGSTAAAGRLRRSATLELIAGVLVLAVTAVLVATPPPMEEMEDMATAAHRSQP